MAGVNISSFRISYISYTASLDHSLIFCDLRILWSTASLVLLAIFLSVLSVLCFRFRTWIISCFGFGILSYFVFRISVQWLICISNLHYYFIFWFSDYFVFWTYYYFIFRFSDKKDNISNFRLSHFIMSYL